MFMGAKGKPFARNWVSTLDWHRAKSGFCPEGQSRHGSGDRLTSMRRFLIGLVVLLILIASVGIGVTVARWPELMLSWQPDRAR
jgi:hypothetical protein